MLRRFLAGNVLNADVSLNFYDAINRCSIARQFQKLLMFSIFRLAQNEYRGEFAFATYAERFTMVFPFGSDISGYLPEQIEGHLLRSTPGAVSYNFRHNCLSLYLTHNNVIVHISQLSRQAGLVLFIDIVSLVNEPLHFFRGTAPGGRHQF